ncbi:amidohydrolase [Mucilaginibacter defluvii]|uniref:Amidohydrolase n=1 Tax=Mucilaginibacter defluvii TaxID=1196019 RepID=A0ABP9FUP5_9SPHI
MKKHTLQWCFLLLLTAAAAYGQKADIIITNGRISTLDDRNTEVQAVAIAGNRIVLTGSNAQVLKRGSPKTRLIDAAGRRVIPGLFDSHTHFIRGGRFYNTELRWDGVTTLKRALQMLKDQSARTPKGQWVRVVGGWNEYQFAEKRLPTPEEINEATGDVPAFILYLYGKAWLNKAGLKALNITGDTPNPTDGLIERDSNGDPTGYLVAEPNAFVLYSTLAKLPELSRAEQLNSTLQFMTELNRLGVTALMDAGGGFQNFPDDYRITDELNKQGKITLRLSYFLFAQKKGTELQDYSKWTGMVTIDEHSNRSGGDPVGYRVEGGGENLVSDAADFENFLFKRPELPATMEKNLKEVVSLLVCKRWPFRIHATYNESITRFLNVIEQVERETPLVGLPWFFDHAETVSDENLDRIKALGGGIAVQHRLAYQGEVFIRRYGRSAAQAAPPVRKMLQRGIRVGLGTDATRVASYNPWVALYWLTTGKTVGGTQVMARENTLERTVALKLLTSGGYDLIGEKQKGKILKDNYADLVILEQDYFKVPEEDIRRITSALTIVDGKIVYGADSYREFAPVALPVMPEWSPVKFYGGYQKN